MIDLVGAKLLKHLKVKHTEYFKESLKGHSHYPSLLSLSDVLSTYQIPNTCVRVDKSKVLSIPVPFIAHVTKLWGSYLYIKEVNNEFIVCEQAEKSNVRISINEFIGHWEGVILLAERSDDSVEPQYKRNRLKAVLRKTRKPFLFAGFMLVLVAVFFRHKDQFTVQAGLFYSQFIILLAGLGISLLLLQHTFHVSGKLANKICNADENAGCSTVLNAASSSFLGIISWSEVGFIYFSGSVVIFAFAASGISLYLSFLLNILALPFTFFSIYQQAFVIKKWCNMCVSIQGALWLQFIVFVYFLPFPSELPWKGTELVTSIAMFLWPALCWVFFKPYFIKANQANYLEKRINKIRRSKKVFEIILQEQAKIEISHKMKTITVVDIRQPVHTLTVITNLYCKPCAAFHKKIETALKKSNNDIRVQMIFLSTGDDEPRFMAAAHLMELQLQKGYGEAMLALKAWYAGKEPDYDKWALQHPVTLTVESLEIMRQHRKWCTDHKISVTPSAFFDGYAFPDVYDIEDITVFS